MTIWVVAKNGDDILIKIYNYDAKSLAFKDESYNKIQEKWNPDKIDSNLIIYA